MTDMLDINVSNFRIGSKEAATVDNTIKSTLEQFYLSTSPTSLVGGSWSNNQPAWTEGKYIWRRNFVTYGDDRTEFTPSENGVCITGNTGAQGAQGARGPQGAAGPNGNTTTTNPVLANAINNANANAVSAVSKVNNLSVGGRNLVLNSHKLDDKFYGAGGYLGTFTVVSDSEALSKYHIETKCTTAGSGPHYPVFQKTADKIGKTYTWSFWAKCSVAKTGTVGHECNGYKHISLTTSWQKFTQTWTYTDSEYYSFTFYLDFKVGEILYIRDFKIEEGTQATTWTPAPEDVDSKVSTANTNASNALSTANTANGTANTAKSKIDNLKVGGRNLWKKTKEYDALNDTFWVDNNVGVRGLTSFPYTIVNGFGVQRIDKSFMDISQRVTIKPNTYYTLSAYIKWEDSTKTSTLRFYDNASPQTGSILNSQVGTTDYKRVSVTFNSGNATISTCRFECDTDTAFLIYGLKLEEGNIATDWTPAPEDAESMIGNIKIGGRSLISNNNSYAGQKPAYIVIHNTDNYAKGANAKAHAKAQHDGNFKGYSAHVYVDDTEAYQALPYNRGAWHVGVNYGGRLFGTVNNRNSVGIEMCVQAGYNYEKAFQNTVQVCKQLMKQLGIPADRVVQHYDVCAKNCPSAIRAKGDWNRFKQLIGAKTDTPTVDKYYRTRKSWADSKSQIGAYKSLENAKKEWKQGYTIYDWNGKAVYPVQTSKKAVVLTGKFEAQLPIIRKGNSGVAVSVLQSVLGVTVDGRFGDDTETSLKVFQKNTGVKANGTCGIDSWKKVIEHVKANTK